MKLSKPIRAGIAAMTCCCMLTTQLVHAAGSDKAPAAPPGTPVQSTIRDVALGKSGSMHGQVIDAQGQPRAAVPVSIIRQGQEVGRSVTDAQGRFAVTGLNGGIYTVATPEGAAMYRAWSPNTAPPSATDQIVMVPDSSVVRGQMGNAFGWLANPWVLAGIVAAAIAIPLALNDDDGS